MPLNNDDDIIISDEQEIDVLLGEYQNPQSVKNTEIGKEENEGGILNVLIRYGFYLLVFLLPLAFFPRSFDILELNKQTLLVGAAVFMSILFTANGIAKSQIRIKKSPIYWGMGALFLSWILAVLFSVYRYNSLAGIEGQQFLSLTTLGSIFLLVFIAANSLSKHNVIGITYAYIFSMLFAALYAFLQMIGIFILPIDSLKTSGFNTIGSYALWGELIVIALLLCVGHIIRLSMEGGFLKKTGAAMFALSASFFVVCLLALDDVHLWISAIIGLAIMLVFLYVKLPQQQKVSWLLLPTFLIVLSATMSFFNLPRQLVALPPDIQVSLKTSYDVARATLARAPLFGFGPGNFQIAYTQFRPKDINAYNIQNAWSAYFQQSGSYALTKVVSTGFVGLAACLFLAFIILWIVGKRLVTEMIDEHYLLLLMSAASLAGLSYLMVVKYGNITIVFTTWLLITCIILLTNRRMKTVSAEQSNKFLILTSFLFFIFLSCGGLSLYFQSQRYSADMLYKKAQEIDQRLGRAFRSGETISPLESDLLIDTFGTAVKKDSSNQTYARAYSQALLFKTNAIMRDREKLASNMVVLQSIADQATKMAKRAYELNPQDVRNAYNLANLYQTISPIAPEAHQLAIEYFKKSIERDPYNPILRKDFANFYLSAAAGVKQQVDAAQTEEARKKGTDVLRSLFSEAETLLEEATELKKDYAIAYFLLAKLKEEQNKTQEAIANLDNALSANVFLAQDANVGDADLFYAIGMDYKTLKEHVRAERAFGLTALLNPNHTPALWELFLSLNENKKKDDALKVLERILEIDPSNRDALTKLDELKAPPPQQQQPQPQILNEKQEERKQKKEQK